jgi:hypothetical protein
MVDLLFWPLEEFGQVTGFVLILMLGSAAASLVRFIIEVIAAMIDEIRHPEED